MIHEDSYKETQHNKTLKFIPHTLKNPFISLHRYTCGKNNLFSWLSFPRVCICRRIEKKLQCGSQPSPFSSFSCSWIFIKKQFFLTIKLNMKKMRLFQIISHFYIFFKIIACLRFFSCYSSSFFMKKISLQLKDLNDICLDFFLEFGFWVGTMSVIIMYF